MLRITGGEFRGRVIRAPGNEKTRPTQARLRQALFNSIQTRIAEARCLDLFAGSSALGFEALSRGAAHVTFVENSRAAAKLIAENAAELRVKDRITLIPEAVEHCRKRLERSAPFDLVLADPPYAAAWEEKLLRDFPWGALLSANGILCLEWGTQKSAVSELPDRVPYLVKVREKNYGDSVLTTYEREESGS